MKKNIKLLLVMIASSITLIGCDSDLPNMKDEHVALIGEYAASLLVRYDASNKSRLVDVSLIEETTTEENKTEETKDEKKSGMSPVEDTPIVNEGGKNIEPNIESNISLEEILQLPEGVTITFLEDAIMKSYPKDNEGGIAFGVDAVEGKELLVLTFSLSNQTQTDQTIDILSKSFDLKVNINNQLTRSTLPTLLIDDLSNYVEVIPAGTDKKLVLVTELNQNAFENISSLSLKVKYNNQSSSVFLR